MQQFGIGHQNPQDPNDPTKGQQNGLSQILNLILNFQNSPNGQSQDPNNRIPNGSGFNSFPAGQQNPSMMMLDPMQSPVDSPAQQLFNNIQDQNAKLQNLNLLLQNMNNLTSPGNNQFSGPIISPQNSPYLNAGSPINNFLSPSQQNLPEENMKLIQSRNRSKSLSFANHLQQQLNNNPFLPNFPMPQNLQQMNNMNNLNSINSMSNLSAMNNLSAINNFSNLNNIGIVPTNNFAGAMKVEKDIFVKQEMNVEREVPESGGHTRTISDISDLTSNYGDFPSSSKNSSQDDDLRRSGQRRTGPVRRSKRGGWSEKEDETLKNAVAKYQAKNWKKIAECVKGRTAVQCLHRWQKVLDPTLIKGPWTKEEDQIIIDMVAKHGAENWTNIASHLNGRIGKQCRERWVNHLNPDIKKGPWTEEEEKILIEKQTEMGNKWAEISKFIPGRSDNSCKNHFNSLIARKKNPSGKRRKSTKKNSPPSLIKSEPANFSVDVKMEKPFIDQQIDLRIGELAAQNFLSGNGQFPIKVEDFANEEAILGHQRSFSDSDCLIQYHQQLFLQKQREMQKQNQNGLQNQYSNFQSVAPGIPAGTLAELSKQMMIMQNTQRKPEIPAETSSSSGLADSYHEDGDDGDDGDEDINNYDDEDIKMDSEENSNSNGSAAYPIVKAENDQELNVNNNVKFSFANLLKTPTPDGDTDMEKRNDFIDSFFNNNTPSSPVVDKTNSNNNSFHNMTGNTNTNNLFLQQNESFLLPNSPQDKHDYEIIANNNPPVASTSTRNVVGAATATKKKTRPQPYPSREMTHRRTLSLDLPNFATTQRKLFGAGGEYE